MAGEAELHPANALLARLERLKDSDTFRTILLRAGVSFDDALTQRDNYSHKTRIRAWLPRVQASLRGLQPGDRDKATEAMAWAMISGGLAESGELTTELANLGLRLGISAHEEAPEPAGGSEVRHAEPSRQALMVVALPLEATAVLGHLDSVVDVEHESGTVYHAGVFSGETHKWGVAVCVSGMGNPKAAVEAERAISFFRPALTFFVGVAGGVKDVQLGDVVVADKVYQYESGKADSAFAPRPEVWRPGYPVLQRARAVARTNGWWSRARASSSSECPRVHIKPIAAGEKVVTSTTAEAYEVIKAHYGDSVAVEMEGAGFLHAAYANAGTVALVVRGISDLVEGKAESDKAGWQRHAAEHAAAFAFEVLSTWDPRSVTVARGSAAQSSPRPRKNAGSVMGLAQSSTSVVLVTQVSGLGLRVINAAAETRRDARLVVSNALKWDEAGRTYTETRDVHQNGSFQEMECGRNHLFCNQPTDLGQVHFEANRLTIEGAAQNGRAVVHLKSPGIWRLEAFIESQGGVRTDHDVCFEWRSVGETPHPCQCPNNSFRGGLVAALRQLRHEVIHDILNVAPPSQAERGALEVRWLTKAQAWDARVIATMESHGMEAADIEYVRDFPLGPLRTTAYTYPMNSQWTITDMRREKIEAVIDQLMARQVFRR